MIQKNSQSGLVANSLKDCLDHYPIAKRKVAVLMRHHCSHSQNGTETISAGLRYTIDNMDISVGVSRSTLGDVTVDGGAGPIVYKGNSVTAMGVKVAFAF